MQRPVHTAVWTLSDGRAGNVRQADALAQALGLGAVEPWTLRPAAPWRWAAPSVLPGAERAFGPEFAAVLAGPPTLAIGCGRQAALATRLLRRRGARTVQILDPRLDPRHWDLVVAPEHDRLHGANVIPLLGSLHPVDDLWLARARSEFPGFAALPQPRTALLVGGPSAHARFGIAELEALATHLAATLQRDGGSLLATASRRTPAEVRAALRTRFADAPGFVWAEDNDGPNPYAGLLAWADRIVCTPDSVNMLSEACATTAPVFVAEPASVGGRVRDFVDALLARGRIRPLDATLAPFDVEPLRETARVADEVRRRLGL